MRKTCSVLLLVMMLLGLFPAVSVNAENKPYPVTMEQARQYVNQEIEDVFGESNYYPVQTYINGSWLSLNEPAWRDHKALAYGTYFGNTTVNGERRYIGYNPRGNEFPNPNYPPDDDASTSLNGWEWVKEPWLLEGVSADLYYGLPNEKELRQALNQKIIDGIEYSYGSHFNENAGSLFNGTGKNEWWRYVLVIQPPTKYTYGYGRMWHRWDSNKDGKKELWYITMRLAPDILPPDIEVSALTNDSPVYVGTEQTAIAVYKNNSKSAQTFEALFYMAENLVSGETLTLAPGQEVTREYDWLAPDTAGQVELKAEARPVEGEINTANNQKSCTVKVEEIEQPVEPPSLGCQEASSQTYTWDTQYHWTTTSTYTDSEGKTRTRTRHHYQTVTYSETLSATLTVNTKQGIPTDPNNPKPSDRESRGSWEIIPWAKKNGLNPNEVTRAGYGFEVKVETSYSTDWETKVPEKASKKGGTYYGPDKVTADFYDTKGRFVKRVNLVPTKGKAGDKNITWELPSEKHTFQDGSTVYERKHYTDINIPDGKYWVKITVSGAGKSDLCLIQRKAVTIFGDALDDTYTRVSRKGE